MSRLAAVVQSATRPTRLRMYRSYMTSQYEPIEIRCARQDERLIAMLSYAEQAVPYYRELFSRVGIHPRDIHGARDLYALPVLTKSRIRENPDAFHTETDGGTFRQGRTGGSTGQPLQYRMSNEDNDAGVALLYRGWSCGGYRPGDSMAIVAGGSLMSSSPAMISRVRDWLTNFRHLSSYGMTPERMAAYVEFISRWHPQYVRGYASSLFALSRFALDRGMGPYSSVRAVFSTAECLTPAARHVIGALFNCNVFDTYGLNDGGVSAYECAKHSGFHVDLERAVLEVVDEAGRPIVDQPGRILATSLLNRAMPFIRYDTGDIGVMTTETCSCGRTAPLLSTILGRQTDLLVIDDVTIGSPVLTVLMGTTSASWYQIVQTDGSSVTFRIVNPDMDTRRRDEAMIVRSLRQHVGEAPRITFEYLDMPDDLAAGDKHRIIVNRWRRPVDSGMGATLK
jgi:phenylacetate-CoA ligase